MGDAELALVWWIGQRFFGTYTCALRMLVLTDPETDHSRRPH